MPIDLGSIIGFVSVVVAVVALWLETRRSRLTMHADMLLRLDERFCGSSLRRLRQDAAHNILVGVSVNDELGEILDFFSNIAYMVQRGALDSIMAYEGFQYWILRYWQCAQAYIGDTRRVDPESWKTLESLVRAFETIKNRKGLSTLINQEGLHAFLQEESRQKAAA